MSHCEMCIYAFAHKTRYWKGVLKGGGLSIPVENKESSQWCIWDLGKVDQV